MPQVAYIDWWAHQLLTMLPWIAEWIYYPLSHGYALLPL